MLFNSAVFLIFITVFYAAWPLLRGRKLPRWIFLTVASFFFYGWWDWRFLFLLIGSGLLDFFCGLAMVKWPARRKVWLLVSLAGNVGSLAAFKYVDFFIGNANWIARLFGMDWQMPAMNIILPVGISFYTFQSMSYTIDVYRGQLTPTRNVFHFFAFLSLFPQLVAGPILRASDLLPQLHHYHRPTEQERWDGLKLIAFGFFKKVVVADNLAATVNTVWGAPEVTHSAPLWWLIMLLFAYQIYCDFSGYSDIARGLGRWMGYEFMLNFDHPYIADSFADFWRRWHISLSTWFRDYVYIPLGGSRKGPWRAMANLWITMLVSGFWHGADWAFVVWGGVHAGLLSLEKITRWPERLGNLAGRHVRVATVFVLTLITWVFFRAGSVPKSLVPEGGLARALEVLGTMFDVTAWDFAPVREQIWDTAYCVVGIMMIRQLFLHLRLNQVRWDLRAPTPSRLAEQVAVAVVLVCCVFLRGQGHAFIYFQF